MNRRKKGIQIVKARIKKANAKLATNNKPKYISKAQRETIALAEAAEGEASEAEAKTAPIDKATDATD
ncbi:DUF2986 domain-containing protein [Glaciecola sp.]|jgi:hypothetical protein|nr:DUF2986 domain-containing protein [Glaciecola sp.]